MTPLFYIIRQLNVAFVSLLYGKICTTPLLRISRRLLFTYVTKYVTDIFQHNESNIGSYCKYKSPIRARDTKYKISNCNFFLTNPDVNFCKNLLSSVVVDAFDFPGGSIPQLKRSTMYVHCVLCLEDTKVKSKAHGLTCLLMFGKRLTRNIEVRAWIITYNYIKIQVINYPSPIFNCGLFKMLLKVGHGLITPYRKL